MLDIWRLNSFVWSQRSCCAVADLQWLSDDCYLACLTNCGSLTCFHKSNEAILLAFQEKGPNSWDATYFYRQLFENVDNYEENIGKSKYSLCWNSPGAMLICCSGVKLVKLRLVQIQAFGPKEDEENTIRLKRKVL